MPVSTTQPPFSCGLAWPARRMDVCIVRHDGALLLHRHRPTAPAPCRKAVAPSRAGLVVAVAWRVTWYGRADLCAAQGIPCVVGHARSMQASHGGTAHNDTLASHKMALWRRGGRLPQASVAPAALRATRALLRRRTPLRRTRAALLAHVHQTNSQAHLPASGHNIADTATRAGVAEHLNAAAVPTPIAVDLALLTSDDALRTDLALSRLTTAKPHAAPPLALWPTMPGVGHLLRLGLLSARHALRRLPRVQACASSARLMPCRQESAGQRDGTAGQKRGKAHRQWACAAAAVLVLRPNEPGPTLLARWEKTHAQGQALRLLAPPRGRAVS
jgi:hypothetical protein